MPHTYTNGIVTFYEDTGRGPAVVLIHGFSLDSRLWRGQAPALAAAGFRCVRYDVRGHGRTLIPPSGYTWDTYARDLADLLDRLNVERPAAESLSVPAVHLVGLSMGGGVALQFTLDFPERVLSLTLVDSTLSGFGYSPEFSRAIQELRRAVQTEGVRPAFQRLWLTQPFFEGVRRRPEAMALARQMVLEFQAPEFRQGHEEPGHTQPHFIERLPEIKCPSLVVVGENDIEDFRQIAELLSSQLPNARLLTMPGCWHLPPLEEPAAFNEALIAFLRSTSGRGI